MHQRRISTARFLIKFGNPMKTRKISYDVTVRKDCKGGGVRSQGNPNGGVQEYHVFLEKKLISICYVNN